MVFNFINKPVQLIDFLTWVALLLPPVGEFDPPEWLECAEESIPSFFR
jgi:hypothetical protein